MICAGSLLLACSESPKRRAFEAAQSRLQKLMDAQAADLDGGAQLTDAQQQAQHQHSLSLEVCLVGIAQYAWRFRSLP